MASEHPIRILLVEDSEDDALLLSMQLKRDGYEIITKRVDTIDEVQDSLEKPNWDIIISDYVLPGFTGMDTLRLKKELGLEIPCIIISGKITDEIAVETMKAGAADYVLKDNLIRLGPAVQRALDEARKEFELRKAQEKIRQSYKELEQRVQNRTSELKETNRLLEEEIEEHKKAEEAIRESEERFRSVLDNSRDFIYRVNLKTNRFDYESPSAEEILGYSPDELMAMDTTAMQTMIHPDDLSTFQDTLSSLKDTGIAEIEYRQRTKKGNYVWLANRMCMIRDVHGLPAYRIGNIRDITESKKTEEALIQAKQQSDFDRKRLEAILEAMPSAVALVEAANGTFSYLNKRAVDLYGVNYMGMDFEEHVSRLKAFKPDGSPYPPEESPVIHSIELGKEVRNQEITIQREDGRRIPLLVSSTPLLNPQGHITAAIIAFEDITERKKVEDALSKAKEELEDRVKERTEQLQDAYDEIMQSQKELSEANEQLKEYGHRITQVQEEERKRIAYELHDDTAQYLSILKLEIEALIHSGKIQSQEILDKLEYLQKDAERAFNDVRRYSHELRPGVLEHLGLQAALDQITDDINKLKQIQVELLVEGAEPELSEDMKLAFFRIAQEALNNARKHARASKVTLDLKFEDSSVQLVIRDDGVGFNSKEASQKSGIRGSLGLMSMRERANLVNANLNIESQPGRGTKVTLKARINP